MKTKTQAPPTEKEIDRAISQLESFDRAPLLSWLASVFASGSLLSRAVTHQQTEIEKLRCALASNPQSLIPRPSPPVPPRSP